MWSGSRLSDPTFFTSYNRLSVHATLNYRDSARVAGNKSWTLVPPSSILMLEEVIMFRKAWALIHAVRPT